MKKGYMLFLVLLISCSPGNFKTKWLEEQAPDQFTATFETTQGNFRIESKREWSPSGVDRLYQLLKHDFYTDIAIFRVVPGYVTQFGIHSDSTFSKGWRLNRFEDEPVLKSNTKGTIAFARGGPKTRTTQIFINLVDNNPRLDTLSYNGVSGFPVIAEVIEGMDVVEKFYKEYGNALAYRQDSIYTYGNDYLRRNYPELDYIKKAYLDK